jgi:hypothetical protein
LPIVKDVIPNLINGVSQQPSVLRLPTQCEVQTNMYNTVAEGTKKRPPFEHLGFLAPFTDENCFIHYIDRDTTERYVLVIPSAQFDSTFSSDFTQTQVKVFDLAGNEKTVTGSVSSYLSTVNARDNIIATTVADFTFLLNKNTITAKTTTLSGSRPPEGIIFLKQATAATRLYVFVDGVERSAALSSDATNTTDTWFTELNNSIGSGGTKEFIITEFDSSNVHLTRVDGGDFTLHVEAPEANAIAIKDEIEDITDLPRTTKDGFRIKVTGSADDTSDDYYIVHSNPQDENEGIWTEDVLTGISNDLDATTMPIKLIRNPSDPWSTAFDDTFGSPDFSVSNITWSGRTKGDTLSSPDPSFVGRTLNDMFFHKNRLGFLSGENVVLSEIGEFFNFYSTTVLSVLDSDPIDISAPTSRVSILRYALPFNESLLIFSDNQQFKLIESSSGGLTPNSADLSIVADYHHDRQARPEPIGRKVYFSVDRDGFSRLNEFGIIEDLQDETAEDTSSHIPSYIEGNVFEIRGDTDNDVLLVLSNKSLQDMYVYKFLFNRGQKILSSWSKWSIPNDEAFLGLTTIDAIMYIVIRRADGLYLEKLSLQDSKLTGQPVSNTSLGFVPLLDRQVEVAGTYDSNNNKTTWSAPYKDSTWSYKAIYGPAHSSAGGLISSTKLSTNPWASAFNTTFGTNLFFQKVGDHSHSTAIIGRDYTMTYEFSEINLKTQSASGGPTTSRQGDVHTVKKFYVRYFKSGYFQMEITYPDQTIRTHTFTPYTLGSVLTKLNGADFEEGTFKKSIMSRTKDLQIKLKSDSYLPCGFTDAGWEGTFREKKR